MVSRFPLQLLPDHPGSCLASFGAWLTGAFCCCPPCVHCRAPGCDLVLLLSSSLVLLPPGRLPPLGKLQQDHLLHVPGSSPPASLLPLLLLFLGHHHSSHLPPHRQFLPAHILLIIFAIASITWYTDQTHMSGCPFRALFRNSSTAARACSAVTAVFGMSTHTGSRKGRRARSRD